MAFGEFYWEMWIGFGELTCGQVSDSNLRFMALWISFKIMGSREKCFLTWDVKW